MTLDKRIDKSSPTPVGVILKFPKSKQKSR